MKTNAGQIRAYKVLERQHFGENQEHVAAKGGQRLSVKGFSNVTQVQKIAVRDLSFWVQGSRFRVIDQSCGIGFPSVNSTGLKST